MGLKAYAILGTKALVFSYYLAYNILINTKNREVFMKNKYILISILILNMVPFAYAQSKKELKQIIQTQQEQLQEQRQY